MDETLYCAIRKELVAALPEEHVRQCMLTHLIQERGFPPSLIAVEKALRQLPHLSMEERRRIPDRRADILCFAKKESLFPLLLIECKAVKLTPKVIQQVIGYNHFVKACFVAIVNQDEVRTGWFDNSSKKYSFVDYLPTYHELLQYI